MFQNNQDISSAYESYLQYFWETFPTIPPPSFIYHHPISSMSGRNKNQL